MGASILSLADFRGGPTVLSAQRGAEREAALRALRGAAEGQGVFARYVACDFDRGGPWAGLNQLLRERLPALESGARDLLARHHHELGVILPEARPRLWKEHSPSSLTDKVPLHERVRSYPIDRAYRLVHGAIDLLRALRRSEGDAPWLLIFDDFDLAGALVRRFVHELARRGIGPGEVGLVVAVPPDEAAGAARTLGARVHHLGDLRATSDAPDPAEMTRAALALEEEVSRRPRETELHLASLTYSWAHSATPERGLKWHALALSIYNHYGFYEDALRVARPVVADLDRAVAACDGIFRRWDIVSGIFNALVATGEPEQAHRLVLEQAEHPDTPGNDLMGIYYSLAMLNARFMKNPDFGLAERYLDRALDETRRASVRDVEKHFLQVFILNGLAFIRHRQARHEEAIRICREGFEHLQRHLGADEHRLHRSVLLYNIAQVNSATRTFEDALRNYSAAIEMDPNYSEYYNQRGSVYLKMGRLDEALDDYARAIQTSPPYPEVWINCGQAYRLQARWEAARDAYARALDLNPQSALAFLGRAQAHDALGASDAALADYTAALRLEPHQPLALANRATLLYERGRHDECLADLDAALELDPDNADLHLNHAIVAADLGQTEVAARDLERCIALATQAETRADAEARLASLRPSLTRD